MRYLQNTTNFGPRVCEHHVSKLLSKQYAASRGCHNPKCIGSLKIEHQVFDWELKLETAMSSLTVSCKNCRCAPLNKSELLLFNRMCDRLMTGIDLSVASIPSARSVKTLNLGEKLNERTIAVLPRITKNCTEKSCRRQLRKVEKAIADVKVNVVGESRVLESLLLARNSRNAIYKEYRKKQTQFVI